MAWRGRLQLHYRRDGERTVLADRHSGPLRVLKSLHPESAAVCHSLLVHPPGGIAGGDELRIDIDLQGEAHAVITTPGATRFYRSGGAGAVQALHARVAAGARLEWLPLETLCHAGTLADNRLRFDLAPGAEMIGWDLLALGLPASDAPFSTGFVKQSIELPGAWLERSRIDGADTRLLDSPLGWGGRRVLATMWLAGGSPIGTGRTEALLEGARAIADDHALAGHIGCTSPEPRVVVLRALAPRVEPAFGLLMRVWHAWREIAWGLPACAPRVWNC